MINFPRGATLAVLLVVPVLGVLLAGRAAAAAPGTGPPAGPSTVVALGDSAASGEGAGDYEPGTRGEAGDWCHRSPAAYVHHAGLGERSVNLACSGAASRDVRFGSGAHHTEGSQAARLAALAATQRVRTVTLQVGANDAPALGDVAVACIRTFVDPTVGPCRETVGGKWEARVAAMVPEVEGAVADVRAAMRGAGYTEADYVLVLLSYGSPVTERMDALHGARGCPFSRPDAGWTRTVAFPGCRRPSPRSPPAPGPGSSTCPGPPRAGRPAAAARRPRSGSGGSPSTRVPSSTTGSTRRAGTCSRSRSIPAPPGTRRSDVAWASSCAAARRGRCASRRPTARCTRVSRR
ncbi:hypothetical protein ACFQV8_18790 [Pseudonocardia benzenivorans]